jgi:serine/threonine-protein kinase
LRHGVPAALDAIVLRGLSRDQERRFESARSMALELEKAVRPATAVEIAEWVSSLAEASLSERRHILARLERERALSGEAPRSPASAPSTDDVNTIVEPAVARGAAGLVARVWERALGLLKSPGPRETR